MLNDSGEVRFACPLPDGRGSASAWKQDPPFLSRDRQGADLVAEQTKSPKPLSTLFQLARQPSHPTTGFDCMLFSRIRIRNCSCLLSGTATRSHPSRAPTSAARKSEDDAHTFSCRAGGTCLGRAGPASRHDRQDSDVGVHRLSSLRSDSLGL